MSSFLALCAIGCETVVSNELKKNGFAPFDRTCGGVFFSSNAPLLTTMFKANYFLRTVDRVLLVLAKQQACDFDSFFDIITTIEWEAYFHKDAKIIVEKVSTFKSRLASEHTLQAMAHKAICSRLCSLWHIHSLKSNTENEQKVRLYLNHDELCVCLDTSGYPLYKRGYRLKGGLAPLRETVAATLLHLMQWKRKYPLHDGFAGSGTILIEALYYALNIPPSLNRNFAFEHFSMFDHPSIIETISSIKEKAMKGVRTDCNVRISGSDISPSAVSLANANIERACTLAGKELSQYGISHHIIRPEVTLTSFEDLQLAENDGMLISNLPYGKRVMEQDNVLDLYENIAKKIAGFQQEGKNWQMGFLTDKEELKSILQKQTSSLIPRNKVQTRKKQTRSLKPQSIIKKQAVKEGNIQTYFFWLDARLIDKS